MMPKPKRHLHATVQETASPPDTLTPTQSIARIEKAEGNSLYTCRLANDTSILVSLPARFRNVIWLKRGGFVLVDLEVAEGKVAGEIVNVVREEKEWKRMTWWSVFVH